MLWVDRHPGIVAPRVMADPLRIAPLLLFAPLALFACSGHPDTPLTTETSPAVSCGPYGHILPDALPGDRLSASSDLISSVVVSNGLLSLDSPPPAWVATVAELHGPA